jgi:hypothetical protein
MSSERIQLGPALRVSGMYAAHGVMIESTGVSAGKSLSRHISIYYLADGYRTYECTPIGCGHIVLTSVAAWRSSYNRWAVIDF